MRINFFALFKVKIWFQNRRMKWKRSKKAISESQRKQDTSQGKSIAENDDYADADIADDESDSDIDISDDPTMNIDHQSDMIQQLSCESERTDLHTNLGSIDLSRNNPYLQRPHFQGPQKFEEEKSVLSSAVS